MTKRKAAAAKPGASLLASTAGLLPAPVDPREVALRAGFAQAFARLSGESTHDAAALSRYFDHLHAAWKASGDLMGRTWVQALLGSYFALGMQQKRGLGRPRSQLAIMFMHVWHELNLERRDSGLPALVPMVPAKEIAAEVGRLGWGIFTAQQVSSALAKSPEWRDLVSAANYGEKTGN